MKSGFTAASSTVIRGLHDGRGGGFERHEAKPTNAPIENEGASGLKNSKFLRSPWLMHADPRSGSSVLHQRGQQPDFPQPPTPTPQGGWGYAVLTGWQPVGMWSETRSLSRRAWSQHGDVPVEDVVIEKLRDHLRAANARTTLIDRLPPPIRTVSGLPDRFLILAGLTEIAHANRPDHHFETPTPSCAYKPIHHGLRTLHEPLRRTYRSSLSWAASCGLLDRRRRITSTAVIAALKLHAATSRRVIVCDARRP